MILHCKLVHQQHLAINTSVVTIFSEFVQARGHCLCSATRADASEFVKVLSKMYALSTIARMISEMRTFYRLADGNVPSPFTDIHICVPNRPYGRTKKHPTNIETALAEIVTRDAKHIRDLAMLTLVWHDHLTTGQLCQLNAEDLDLAAGTAQVLLRRKPKTLFLTRQSIPYLQRWLAVRGLYHPHTNALFISLHWTDGRSQPHQRLSLRGVFAIRAAYSRRFG